jgi:tRNA pseudouridine38-40 synthase
MRYFIQISYKGKHYKGWQKQKNTDGCIQTIIEEAIKKATKSSDAHIVGCGRTDAGVHASMYFAHIDWYNDSLASCINAINYCLPSDIVIHKIIEVDEAVHARYDATQRQYTYHMHFYPDPFLAELSAYYHYTNLDVMAMNAACEYILHQTDFSHFCKTPLRNKHTQCIVEKCTFTMESDLKKAVFHIAANRFLKSMVRVLVHDVLEVGQGKLSIDDFKNIFINGRKNQINKIAHPQGLYLSGIVYNEKVNITEI